MSTIAIIDTVVNFLHTDPNIKRSRVKPLGFPGPVRCVAGISSERLVEIDGVMFNVTAEQARFCDSCNRFHGFRCPNSQAG